MHPNPAFRQAPDARALAFAAARGFGVLTAAGAQGLLAAHVPFVLEEGRLAAHLVRSNPLARHLAGAPAPALMIVSGPDAYVSPDWYGEADMVPTWNYVAVHLRGTLELLPGDRLRPHLERLSANFEARLAPKAPWTLGKMSAGAIAQKLRQIVPVEMVLSGVESTFKLNQNRAASARAGAAAALAAGGTPGLETAALAALMRAVENG
ncbi:MAG TPA: FMN-binding negative transcriptional regulator [Thermohalobaculum sp.]|nr:FMN-binding negative transcriptional regulator [Thermohalobaculum sp.]